MSVRGIFASHSGIIGDRQTDLSGRILMHMPGGTAPLLALSAGMPSARAADTAFSWIEDSHISGNTEAVATVDPTATQFTVEDANIWTPNTIIMNEATGEYMFITAINGNTISVIRGMSGTAADDITTGDTLQSIGTAFEEGSGKPSPVAQRGESRTNLVQIFKNGWAITGTAQSIDFITGPQLAMNRQQCIAYHAEDIERSFLWGKKDIRVINNRQFRMSNGILAQIEAYGGLVQSANYGSQAGHMALAGLQSFFREIFDKRVKGLPNERIAFTGSVVLELIQNMVLKDTSYRITSNETSYGIQVTKLDFVSGSISLVTHPLMVENAIWQHELYILHPGLIRKRNKRDTWSEEFSPQKQNNNGTDATEGYIADELGFEVKGAQCMGIMRNISVADKSFA